MSVSAECGVSGRKLKLRARAEMSGGAMGPLRGFKVAKISGGREGMVLAVGVLKWEGLRDELEMPPYPRKCRVRSVGELTGSKLRELNILPP